MAKILSLITVLILLTVAVPAAPVQAAARTWTVSAGGFTDSGVFANTFQPRVIEIAVGDTVLWKFRDFHTVTFLSGEQAPPIFVPEGDKLYGNPRVFFPAGGKTYDGTGVANSGAPSHRYRRWRLNSNTR